MNPLPRKMTNVDEDLIKQYLDKGGKVTVGNPGERSEEIEFAYSFYGRRKKKTVVTPDKE